LFVAGSGAAAAREPLAIMASKRAKGRFIRDFNR
jgi:hypothetical protein